ncbi:MAG: hypothetical protein ACKVTZ_24115 [Bacteroidia bacterium]
MLLVFLYVSCASIQAQSLPDTLLSSPSFQLTFPYEAKTFEIDTEGNLLFLSEQPSKVFKYYANTQYDSSIFVGGKAGRSEGFLNLTQLSIPNRQTVYVLDEASRKIVLLNMNFQVVGEIDFLSDKFQSRQEELGELFPTSFGVNNFGEMFVLSYRDNKIHKINKFGELTLNFGGQDYGEGSLDNPTKIAMNTENYIWVSDTVAQTFTVFDRFGGFQYKLNPSLPFRWEGFSLFDKNVLCYNNEYFAIVEAISQKRKVYDLPKELQGKIKHIIFYNKNVYILKENQLFLQKL